MVLVIGQNSTWQNTYNIVHLKQGEVNRIHNFFFSAAGKGANVVRSLKVLEKRAHLLAYAGGVIGDKFKRACREDGLECSFIQIQNETRMCTTIIESTGKVTELVEPAPKISSRDRDVFLKLFTEKIKAADFLVITGTAINGELSDCYKNYIIEAKKLNIPVLLDSYRRHGEIALEASPEILKINKQEIEELTGRRSESLKDRISVYREIADKYGISWIVITKGAGGAEGWDGKEIIQACSHPIELINSIGSGDAFSAGFISSILDDMKETGVIDSFPANYSLERAVISGTAMGTANCMNIKPGYVENPVFKKICTEIDVKKFSI